MTRHDQDAPRDGDTRLTDHLFGELDAEAARALEEELARDPALRAEWEELRATHALLEAAAPDVAPVLAEERRAALRAEAAATAAEEASPRGRVLRFPAWARAAAALAIVAGVVAVWKQAAAPEAEAGALTASGPAVDPKVLESLGYAGDSYSSALQPVRPASGAPGAGGEREARGGAYLGPADAVPPSDAPAVLGLGGGGATLGWNEPAPLQEAILGEVLRLQAEPSEQPFVGLLSTTPPAAGGLVAPDAAGAPATPGAPAAKRDGADRGLRAEESDRSRYDRNAGDARARLKEMGYADESADFDDDPSLGRYGLDDGYGRRHEGRDVLVHLHRRGNESPRDMFYRYYGDNAAVRTAEDALSTFATDVDTASWALARNYLVQGHLPPKAAVRTEECVNAFRQELAPPAEGDFAIHLEAAPTPFAPESHLLLRVGLKAREVDRAARKPLNLVFVVDKSGSMAQQDRIELVKQSLELLVDQIRDDDTIGIVAFDSDAHEILAPTAGAERWKIREALRKLSTGGSTNAAEGLTLGYAMAERAFRKDAVNRVVLASDGVANTGETDQAEILAKVRKSAEADVDLTTIGVGMGNHNDVFLERLADDGDGSCHYVDTFEEAKRVFVERFTGTMQVVAREARVQVEFAPGVVREWRQLGYENRAMRDQDFRNDAVDAGEIGAGHEMVALYELRLADLIDGPDRMATVCLRWKPDGASEFVEIEKAIGLGDARSRWDLASPRFRLAGTVAQFAEFLRRSVHARGDSYDDLRERAGALARELRGDPMVAEFRDLVDRTAELARHLWPDDELAMLIEEARRTRLLECELEAMSERSEKAERLLQEVRLQNEALERRLEELLQPR